MTAIKHSPKLGFNFTLEGTLLPGVRFEPISSSGHLQNNQIYFDFHPEHGMKIDLFVFCFCLFLWTPSFEGIRYPYWDFAYPGLA